MIKRIFLSKDVKIWSWIIDFSTCGKIFEMLALTAPDESKLSSLRFQKNKKTRKILWTEEETVKKPADYGNYLVENFNGRLKK